MCENGCEAWGEFPCQRLSCRVVGFLCDALGQRIVVMVIFVEISAAVFANARSYTSAKSAMTAYGLIIQFSSFPCSRRVNCSVYTQLCLPDCSAAPCLRDGPFLVVCLFISLASCSSRRAPLCLARVDLIRRHDSVLVSLTG